jgi:hypothetical protein
LLLQSKGALFSLLSVWSLRMASLAHGRVAESQSGETLETPYSAALGFATALGFLPRVGVLCCVVFGGDPELPLHRKQDWAVTRRGLGNNANN